MIELRQASYIYEGNRGVHDLSFRIPSGSVTGFFGTNGDGKTTTFRLILGLLHPQRGTVTIDHMAADRFPKQRIGYVPEERCLYPNVSVGELLMLIGYLKGMKRAELTEAIRIWLARFGLERDRTRKLKELSKGNQQLVQILCAMIHRPDVIVLDEPFNGLDSAHIRLVRELVRERSSGQTVLISMHQKEWIPAVCDACVYFEQGTVKTIEEQTMREFTV